MWAPELIAMKQRALVSQVYGEYRIQGQYSKHINFCERVIFHEFCKEDADEISMILILH